MHFNTGCIAPGCPAARRVRLQGVPKTASGSAAVADKEGYTLVWADEFNATGPPGTQHRRFEKGFMRNHELQWYQPDNARCEKGADHQRKKDPGSLSQQPHYRLLNLSIGGDPVPTRFPNRFAVDYVRVYRRLKKS